LLAQNNAIVYLMALPTLFICQFHPRITNRWQLRKVMKSKTVMVMTTTTMKYYRSFNANSAASCGTVTRNARATKAGNTTPNWQVTDLRRRRLQTRKPILMRYSNNYRHLYRLLICPNKNNTDLYLAKIK